MAQGLPAGWNYNGNNNGGNIITPTNDAQNDTTYQIKVEATYDGQVVGEKSCTVTMKKESKQGCDFSDASTMTFSNICGEDKTITLTETSGNAFTGEFSLGDDEINRIYMEQPDESILTEAWVSLSKNSTTNKWNATVHYEFWDGEVWMPSRVEASIEFEGDCQNGVLTGTTSNYNHGNNYTIPYAPMTITVSV